jgi:hypothetical protein
MTTNDWIALLKIIFSSAGTIGLAKFLWNKYDQYKINEKRGSDRKHTVNSFKNVEQIYNNVIHIGQDYNCSYVHITAIHDSGKAMNEINDKKITIKSEYRKDSIIPKIKHEWKNREIDFDWFPLINKVLDEDFVHIDDVTKTFDKNNGLRLMYNTGYGVEFFISKIDWVGDTLVLLIIQREHQSRVLTTKEKAFLNYKSKELINLFSNAKYFLEGKN